MRKVAAAMALSSPFAAMMMMSGAASSAAAASEHHHHHHHSQLLPMGGSTISTSAVGNTLAGLEGSGESCITFEQHSAMVR